MHYILRNLATKLCIFPQTAKAIIYDNSGSVLPLVGIAMLVLVGATGAAIDSERAQQVQAKLSSSLDAAGLAAGATISTNNVATEVEKYMHTNFDGYLGATLTNITATVDNSNSVITLSATANVPTTLMRALGKNSITVQASAEIIRASKGLELVMVLDNTGSMSGSKLRSLKSAATDMVNILYGNKDKVDNLWIGLVPFSQAVNIGSNHSSWTTADNFDWGTTSWSGCVDAREVNGLDVTDDPPSVATFPKYYWPCHKRYNAWFGTNRGRNNCKTSGTIRYRSRLGMYRGPNKYCPQPVTPLTASKNTIINAINSMRAVGYTHINLGAAWGWRMLSPRWRGLWGGEMNRNNLPLDYNTNNMNKAVIIMTDGDNTMSSRSHTAYWYLTDGKLGTTRYRTATAELDKRLLQVCTMMKNKNIIVYTISFGSISSSSRNMMRSCASQPDYYFHSPNSTTLRAAFRAIGDSLANLRVSK